MKYDHMVKVNGRYYPAGTEIPNKSNKVVEETLPPYSDEDIVLETKEDTPKQYSKTEIMRMTTGELQDLALGIGINGADEMTGSTLKKLLVEHFGL